MAATISLPVGRAVEQAHLRAGSVELYSVGDAVRVFAVRSPKASNDESYALYHPDVPVLRSPHPTRPLWLQSKSARQADDKNGCIWEVTCNYGLDMGAEFPWQEPPVYSWASQATEQICDYDVVTNKAIKNSAGAPFDPGVNATRYEPTLTVSRNELEFNIARALSFVGAVNSNTFYGAARGFCMCTAIPATTQYFIDQRGRRTRYWSVQYQFAFRNTFSWQPKVLDAGYYKKGGSGNLLPITIGGREPSSPVPLNGSGQPLSNPDTDDPTFLDFKVYPEKNFSQLGV